MAATGGSNQRRPIHWMHYPKSRRPPGLTREALGQSWLVTAHLGNQIQGAVVVSRSLPAGEC